MADTIHYVATCLFGLESLLADEIEDLGYTKVDTMDGRVTFTGDLDAVAHCNIWLRFAERVFIKVGGPFDAVTFDQLFEGVKALPWEDWLGANANFPVGGHSVKSQLTSLPALQSIIKKAIVDRMSGHYGITIFPEDGVKYPIEFFLFKDKVTLMIDTSGEALHKRGYRPEGSVAPIRETLAAALAKLSRPREDVLFWDPFCGSGTIPIEAAMIMKNQAPGLHRKFLAQTFPQFPRDMWNDAYEEARSLIENDITFEAYASDIDADCVDLSKRNIKKAGVDGHVKCFHKDALKIETGGRKGTVVCNPPYGDRMMTPAETNELYKKMGEHFGKALKRWQIYVITSHDKFTIPYGRRADKIRKLYNGMIPCYYYQFFKPVDEK